MKLNIDSSGEKKFNSFSRSSSNYQAFYDERKLSKGLLDDSVCFLEIPLRVSVLPEWPGAAPLSNMT